MAFRAGGTGWNTYQQGTSRPGAQLDRAQSKAVTISEQERLIQQKKEEIQRKKEEKKRKEEEAKTGGKKPATGPIKFNIGNIGRPAPAAAAASTEEPASSAPPVEPPAAPGATQDATDTDPATKPPEPVQNVFSNDGSFLEQFRKMQEQQAGQIEASKPPSPKPVQSSVSILQTQPTMPSVPVQPVTFSTVPTQSKKSSLPMPKPSVFRDSDDEEEDALAAEDPELLPTINRLAEEVAEGGLMVEEAAKKAHRDDPHYEFLFDHDSPDHKYYQKRLVEMRLNKKIRAVREIRQSAGTSGNQQPSRKRKSRWMEAGPSEGSSIPPPKITIIAPGSVGASTTKLPGVGGVGGTGPTESGLGGVEDNDWGFGASGGVATSSLGSTVNPVGMIGTTELSAAQLKQLKEQQEMQRMVDSMVKYHNKMAASGQSREGQRKADPEKRNKYAYDSDEDTEGGTWEHKQRTQEMDETKERAEILTRMGRGKHHLGDFLPPDELEKFLETLEALKEGRTPDFSDYQKFKIQADNIGYQMLKKLGWEEGQGLGSMGQGITAPVNKGSASAATTGLGIDKASNLTKDDAEDEFSAYRKRMMLAYRFRPNPLNNPRRPYY